MSKIETIRAALKALLEKITVANGYENTVSAVSTEFVYGEGTTYPCLFVITPDTDFAEETDQHAEAREQVLIYGMIKDRATPQADLNSLRSDIIQAVAADITLGGLAASLCLKKARNAGDIFNEPGYAPGFKPPHACLCVHYELEHQIDMRQGS